MEEEEREGEGYGGDQRTGVLFTVLGFNGTWFRPPSIPLGVLMKIVGSSNSALPFPLGSVCIAIASLYSEHELICARVIVFYSEVPKSCWRYCV